MVKKITGEKWKEVKFPYSMKKNMHSKREKH